MRRAAFRLALGLAMTCGFASPALAQGISWYRFDPLVLLSTSTQPVRLEALVTGAPSRVALELAAGGFVEMRDDGTDGDTKAGDGVFTGSIPAATILSALRADDVQRVFVGFLTLFNGSTSVFRGNMFADVHTAEVGAFDIVRLAPDAQATSRVFNLADPQYLTDFNLRRVTQTFYRFYGDDFDFLNIISTPSRIANRTHTVVRNDVSGIGLPPSDGSALYGSAGRLRGYSLFPIPGFYDGAGVGFSHETGHQWINYLPFDPFAAGRPHWPASSMATGTMGFSIGGAGGQGGDFNCRIVDQGGVVQLMPQTEAKTFTDFDLYLMGLMPPASVGPQVVLSGVTSPPACNGQMYTGTVARVSINDIIAGAGPRIPATADAPKRFRSATILVSRDGLVSRETMWLYSWFTARAELETATRIHEGFSKSLGNPFFLMTGGRASIDTLLASEPDFSLQAAQAAVTVARGAPATFRISAMPTRASFDQPITFSCGTLPAPLRCTFAPAQVTPGSAGVDVTLTVTTSAAAEGVASGDGAAVLLLLVPAVAAATRRRVLRHRSGRALRLADARSGQAAWIAAALVLLLVGCSGSKPPATPSNPGQPSGPSTTIYTITVTATSGTLAHSAILTLTVQ
jgi:hypothetical protein